MRCRVCGKMIDRMDYFCVYCGARTSRGIPVWASWLLGLGISGIVVTFLIVFVLPNLLPEDTRNHQIDDISPAVTSPAAPVPIPGSTVTPTLPSTPAPTPMPTPDLIIKDITWAPENPIIGQTITFTVEVKNKGDSDASSSSVYYFVDGEQKGFCAISPIIDGDISAQTFTWSAEPGSHTIKAVADYNSEVPEIDEANNQKAVTLFITPVLFLSTLGTNDQFHNPCNIAVDNVNNVYVADHFEYGVQKFSASGEFLSIWITDKYATHSGIAVDSAGNVYVTTGNKVQKLNSAGWLLTEWGNKGSDDGQFDYPYGIAVDNAGNVYVTDGVNDRVQKFSANGKFLSKWGISGSGNGQFQFPSGIAVDGASNVYVTDTGNNRVQKFSADGEFLQMWGIYGKDDGQFNYPCGLAVDNIGNVYVVDNGNERVQKFSASGEFLYKWGKKGWDDIQFVSPKGIAVDSAGNVYVTDQHRVKKFSQVDISILSPISND